MEKFKFSPIILKKFFTDKAIEMCKSCKRYGKKATCPPYIDGIDYYRKILPSYAHGILLMKKFKVDIKNWKVLGIKSSLDIQAELIKIRNELLGKSLFAIAFGAGSCKICPVCQIPCRHPEKSIIPMEGTGLNVVSLVKKVSKIKLTFPVEKQEFFYRVGMVLYD